MVKEPKQYAMKIVTTIRTKKHMGFDVVAVTDTAGESEDVKDSRIRKFSSSRLFETSKEVMIEHGEEIYFLRLTRQNKLILTK